jgi:chromosome segregation ATPase
LQLADRLRNERAASQTSHNNRRHQLDLHLGEIDELRRALSDQAAELHRAEEENNRIATDKGDVARTVAALEADLKRVKRDAQAFGRDLKLLRAEKDKLEDKRKEAESKAQRARKQAEAQIRLLSEQLASQRERARNATETWDNHVCVLWVVFCIRRLR